MIARYKNKCMNSLFNTMLEQARTGELLHTGNKGLSLRTGNAWRVSFWRGYHHAMRGSLPAYSVGTMEQACYMAGKEYRKETDEYVGLSTTAGTRYTIMDQKEG